MADSSNPTDPADIYSYIASAAQARGIDPSVATRVFGVESGYNPTIAGDNGSSFGIAQLHYGGISPTAPHAGLGDTYTAQTGYRAGDPAHWKDEVNFALDQAKKSGWAPWTTTRDKLGIGNFTGIGNAVPTNQPSSDDFLTDFDVAPGKNAPAPSAAPASSASPSVSGDGFTLTALPDYVPPKGATPESAAPSTAPQDDFLKDFEVAPAGTSVQAQQAPSAPAESPITLTNQAIRATANGIPVIGGLMHLANPVNAYIDAGLAPVLNPLFPQNEQLQGDTFDQRYQNALAIQNGLDQQFAQNHPIANTAANIAGGVLGTAGLATAAPAAFGIGAPNLYQAGALSGVTGGVLNGLDYLTRNAGNINPTALASNAGLGFLFGGVAPFVGHAAGAGINALSNAFNRTTPEARNIANVLSEIGMTPTGARSALATMGPQATLADIDPALTAEAGSLASMGGQPTSVLKNAMRTRAANADDRVASAIDTYLGPKPDLDTAEAAIMDRARATASPHYNAASSAPMDITPVLSYIDNRLPTTTGGVRNALSTARGYLARDVTIPGADGRPTQVSIPRENPQELLGARQALDDFIERRGDTETSAGRNALREATEVRGRLDRILKADSNIAAGDAAYSSQMRIRNALEQGRDVFSTRLDSFNHQISGLSPDELDAYRSGARIAIGDALEAARRGELSQAQSMFARASGNRAKLDALFPNSGRVFDMLNAEAAMRSTEQQVAYNSATAERRAIAEKYKTHGTNTPIDAGAAFVGNALGGPIGAVGTSMAKSAVSGFRNALQDAAQRRLAGGMARALAATGRPQSAFLDQLDRAYYSNPGTAALAHHTNALANVLTRNLPNALLPVIQSPLSPGRS